MWVGLVSLVLNEKTQECFLWKSGKINKIIFIIIIIMLFLKSQIFIKYVEEEYGNLVTSFSKVKCVFAISLFLGIVDGDLSWTSNNPSSTIDLGGLGLKTNKRRRV